MTLSPNTFADRFNARFGILGTTRPVIGESFDRHNDLVLIDPCTVLHRDGHITRGTALSAPYDALIDWNRRNLRADVFAAFYGDDPTENN